MTVNVGVLGFAHGHVSAYCRQWLHDASFDIKLVAGWDHDTARLAKSAESFGVRPYNNVADFLAHPDLHAVVIGGETSLHADLVEQAAAAGKTTLTIRRYASCFAASRHCHL